MKLFKACFLFFVVILICGCRSLKPDVKSKESWISLFNGKDLDDWFVKIHHHDVGVNFGNTFRVEDGVIKVSYDQYGDFNDQFGHLYYKVPFSYYHLVVEYRFTGQLQKGAPSYTLRNSGVMFHSQDPRTMPKEQDWPISIEMQFLGGLGDGKPRPTGNMCSPGTNVVYKGKIAGDHCINSSSRTYDGDQWVKAELIVLGDSLITHVINGGHSATVLQATNRRRGS
ncbi:MAG: 3-keto-disaccharide hydrolase [Arcticibacter sp.]